MAFRGLLYDDATGQWVVPPTGTLLSNNANGQAGQANSAPVTLANENIQDLVVTGAASTALNTNLFRADGSSAAYDTMNGAGLPSYRSFSAQLVVSATLSAGQIVFEQSNDGVTWWTFAVAQPALQATSGQQNQGTVGIAGLSAGAMFQGRIWCRYIRCRIVQAMVGGTVQLFGRLTTTDNPNSQTTVVSQATPSALNTLITLPVPTTHTLTSAATVNSTLVKSTSGMIFTFAVFNAGSSAFFLKLYNKATAPTVGTDPSLDVIPIAAGAFQLIDFGNLGLRFTTGIGYALTGGAADSDSTAIAAGSKIHMAYV